MLKLPEAPGSRPPVWQMNAEKATAPITSGHAPPHTPEPPNDLSGSGYLILRHTSNISVFCSGTNPDFILIAY
ncbi:MAG TPA: hypothetical protein PK659_11315, partial [Methanothrix sp.]